MTTSESVIQLRQLIGEQSLAMLTSRAPDGSLHSRPLTIGEIDDAGRLVFLVDSRADWVAGLTADEPVNLAVTSDDDKIWISVSGTSRISEDRATIDRLWSPTADAYFPDGVESPYVRVLTVDALSAEFWDAPSSVVERAAALAGSLLGKKDARFGDSGTIDLK